MVAFPLVVLDEADRILDMGFERELNAIVRNLPRTRQTMLFSATLTKNIRQLARLSLQVRYFLNESTRATHDSACCAEPRVHFSTSRFSDRDADEAAAAVCRC